MGYEDDNVVGFNGPRVQPTHEDYELIIECIERLLEKAKNKQIMGISYAYVTGEDLGGRCVSTNWVGIPGVSKHVMVASVRYLEHDMIMDALASSK